MRSGAADWRDLDDDGDGAVDAWERVTCVSIDTDRDGSPDERDPDADGDGIGDRWEATASSWARQLADTDQDGLPDTRDLDTDGDGLSDAEEGQVTTADAAPADTDGDRESDYRDLDADGDGVPDAAEVAAATSPTLADTDGDGFSDGVEAAAGAHPGDAADAPHGTVVEVRERTFVEVGLEVPAGPALDVVVVLDASASMTEELARLAVPLAGAHEVVLERSRSPSFALISFRLLGALVARVEQVSTTTPDAVVRALPSLAAKPGGGYLEAMFEATYQAIAGRGYDKACNGAFDADEDIPPFIPHPDDAFHGAAPGLSGAEAALGDEGGVGLRAGAASLFVVFTDEPAWDPDSPDPEVQSGLPGGCPFDGSSSAVVDAIVARGGWFMGVDTGTGLAMPQLTDVAVRTGSTSGVGTWAFNLRVPQLEDGALTTAMSDVLYTVLASPTERRVTWAIADDPHGFVQDIVDPSGGVIPAGALTADVTVVLLGVVAATTEDQVFPVTLAATWDDGVETTLPLYVVVPGATGGTTGED